MCDRDQQQQHKQQQKQRPAIRSRFSQGFQPSRSRLPPRNPPNPLLTSAAKLLPDIPPPPPPPPSKEQKQQLRVEYLPPPPLKEQRQQLQVESVPPLPPKEKKQQLRVVSPPPPSLPPKEQKQKLRVESSPSGTAATPSDVVSSVPTTTAASPCNAARGAESIVEQVLPHSVRQNSTPMRSGKDVRYCADSMDISVGYNMKKWGGNEQEMMMQDEEEEVEEGNEEEDVHAEKDSVTSCSTVSTETHKPQSIQLKLRIVQEGKKNDQTKQNETDRSVPVAEEEDDVSAEIEKHIEQEKTVEKTPLNKSNDPPPAVAPRTTAREEVATEQPTVAQTHTKMSTFQEQIGGFVETISSTELKGVPSFDKVMQLMQAFQNITPEQYLFFLAGHQLALFASGGNDKNKGHAAGGVAKDMQALVQSVRNGRQVHDDTAEENEKQTGCKVAGGESGSAVRSLPDRNEKEIRNSGSARNDDEIVDGSGSGSDEILPDYEKLNAGNDRKRRRNCDRTNQTSSKVRRVSADITSSRSTRKDVQVTATKAVTPAPAPAPRPRTTATTPREPQASSSRTDASLSEKMAIHDTRTGAEAFAYRQKLTNMMQQRQNKQPDQTRMDQHQPHASPPQVNPSHSSKEAVHSAKTGDDAIAYRQRLTEMMHRQQNQQRPLKTTTTSSIGAKTFPSPIRKPTQQASSSSNIRVHLQNEQDHRNSTQLATVNQRKKFAPIIQKQQRAQHDTKQTPSTIPVATDIKRANLSSNETCNNRGTDAKVDEAERRKEVASDAMMKKDAVETHQRLPKEGLNHVYQRDGGASAPPRPKMLVQVGMRPDSALKYSDGSVKKHVPTRFENTPNSTSFQTHPNTCNNAINRMISAQKSPRADNRSTAAVSSHAKISKNQTIEVIQIPPDDPEEERIRQMLTKYGLVVIKRGRQNKILWIACKFCAVFKCKTKGHSFLQCYKSPFSENEFIRHLEMEHENWKDYNEANAEGKRRMFAGKTLPPRDVFRNRIEELEQVFHQF